MPRLLPTEEINAALSAVIGRPRSVLVAGAGTGASAWALSQVGARVVGIEVDPDRAARARRSLDEVHVVDPCDLERVGAVCGQQRFDLICMPGLLEQAQDPEAVLRSYLELLEPEGRMVLSVRNRDAWPLRFGLGRPELGYPDLSGSSPRFWSLSDLESLVVAAGLELLESNLNPQLLRTGRELFADEFALSLRPGEEEVTGYRDLGAYQLYLKTLRPLEVSVARAFPAWLAYQHVLVVRRPLVPRPLSLTVGMLTMDEEPSVERMLGEIRRYAPDARILCIDSSVRDQTPFIAERLGARVIRQLPPRGHGPAMELLMYEASAESDALIYLDCDFTYPPAVIPALRRLLESGVDVVNAARTRRRPAAMPWPNYLANKAFAWAGQALSGVPAADLHSGMRAYRSSLIRAFAFDGEGDALPVDTLLWPARRGYRVVEVPIDYQERVGVSKLRKLAGTVWTFARLGGVWTVGSRRGSHYDVRSTLDE